MRLSAITPSPTQRRSPAMPCYRRGPSWSVRDPRPRPGAAVRRGLPAAERAGSDAAAGSSGSELALFPRQRQLDAAPRFRTARRARHVNSRPNCETRPRPGTAVRCGGGDGARRDRTSLTARARGDSISPFPQAQLGGTRGQGVKALHVDTDQNWSDRRITLKSEIIKCLVPYFRRV